MSDDSFIREVEEELRSDRLKNFWDNFKYLIIGGAIAIVAATAGYRYWDYHTSTVAAASGDRFLEAIERSDEGEHDAVIELLEKLSEEGSGQYPALAKIRLAAEYARKGNIERAIEAFDFIANDTGFDETLRMVAQLSAGLLQVDHGSYAEVNERLQGMADTGKSFRHSAREGLGLAAWKARKYDQALIWFTAITDDIEAPQGVRERARIMLDLLAGEGIRSESEQSRFIK